MRVERFDGAIWEPACGEGHMARVLESAGYSVTSTDLVPRGFGQGGVDFLLEHRPLAPNIVTNPPFKLAEEFVRHALRLTTGKVAMLLRLQFLEGKARGRLFAETPLARVLVFSGRLTFAARAIGGRNGDGKGGGMVAFAWFIWEHGHEGPPSLGWLNTHEGEGDGTRR